ncbi:DUF4274 domain-containing protein [Halalkalibacterium halodurans]|uniref:BH2340 protein n=1 Tax=Halalkalibacterium halodurans (strain ATCC BAA-125 / DSM 18197 / FERM 7344 / JCM 9153 / C-125) TaxID=272558 RepID=Q9KAE7_HALH5|nr:DUF4274 domain-containing protein [Halalkalibacterium halodurans]MDY7222891.1 DUF4274 domain-containing protein [Halalkalibacterium halodurans]MDY7242112.1 DUF4274 domain-containing protein [Halalkalibacterium halodurans]MED4080877.1 DUF4274 domain-containing protein [Halalkalibacterium halodurans]MED4085060.1 DUF4274 domain-containing protein [Halalkalibacterium halodurans]MED4105362.1 DUF4274 domain-containing protein [Halalkalibacterium halodurans]
MDKKDINFLEELLYSTDKNNLISQLSNLDNPLMLHIFAANYNWNSGFDVPKAIIENEQCDFGTGLLMFHYADGLRMLENPEEVSSSSLKEWKDFLSKIYNKLINLEFKSQNISFDPELTKIQKYKLKKNNPNLPDILIDKSSGEMVDIPKI